MMRWPDINKKETAIDVLNAEGVDSMLEVNKYLQEVFFAWHDGVFGKCDLNDVIGIMPGDEWDFINKKLDIRKYKQKLTASISDT